jgi:hypothetical protein
LPSVPDLIVMSIGVPSGVRHGVRHQVADDLAEADLVAGH